ncbi:MAG: phosphate ABC transporter permease subunit PstC [Betaproteobacteria bacterium]|nr:phosphate ABC transporter permease subunit PstC [Betaproteobacteria bacterium]
MSFTEIDTPFHTMTTTADLSQAEERERLATRLASQKWQDVLFKYATLFFALLVLAMLAAIIGSLLLGAYPAFQHFGIGFLVSTDWNPVTAEYGAANAIYGTVVTSLIALLIAIPVSFGIAVFLTELCPAKLRRSLGTAVELLAGVPSIIYGMWGLFVFAPVFSDYIQPGLQKVLGGIPVIGKLVTGPFMGIGMLAAGIILAVMVIPFIASVMRDVFEVVPPMLKESAYGLGATTWEVVRNIVLPYTKVGVVGGIMLGLGRALGETMAVTFVIGNAQKISPSLFEPGNSIASTLANEFAEASKDMHVASLISLGLVLFIITFVVLAIAKLMLMQLAKREGTKT